MLPLSKNILTSTLEQIRLSRQHEYLRLPSITYIVPVFNCNADKIFATLKSIHDQIGVTPHAIIVIDGPQKSDLLNVQNAINKISEDFQSTIIQKRENGGVAKARNTGMKYIRTEFFSWVDSHDLLHPLRSIHAISHILNTGSSRINTAYSRVNLESKKIYLRNHRLFFIGHTSFVSRKDLLNTMGYLLDLKRHEDTEYERRHEFFNIKITENETVGHYLDLEAEISEKEHLSGDTWGSRQTIEGHPYLQGSYHGSITNERKAINASTSNLYRKIMEEVAENHFPCIE